MFSHITWMQYLLAASILLLCYYATVLLLYFRPVLQALLSKSFRSPKDQGLPPLPGIMGAVAPDPDRVAAEDVRVAPAALPAEHGAPAPDAFAPEVMTDLVQELDTLLAMVSQNPGSKADFCSLLRLVLTRYTAVLPDHLQDQVNRLLLEKTRDPFPVALTAADLHALWQEAPATTDTPC